MTQVSPSVPDPFNMGAGDVTRFQQKGKALGSEQPAIIDIQEVGKLGSRRESTAIKNPVPSSSEPHPAVGEAEITRMIAEVKMQGKAEAKVEGEAIGLADEQPYTPQMGTITKRDAPVSSARSLPGQRIYHVKKDILPWMGNMYKSAQRVNQQVHDEFVKMVAESDKFTPEQQAALIKMADEKLEEANQGLVDAMETRLQSPELASDTNKEIVADKQEGLRYKEIAKQSQTEAHGKIKAFIGALEGEAAKIGDLSNEGTQEIGAFAAAKTKDTPNMEGLKRFEIIHEDSMWDPTNVTARYMSLNDSETGESMRATSTFQAMGPGYSSQANRNRSLQDEPVAPNFWRTELLVKPEGGAQDEKVMSITRSAITVEFDQSDPTERAQVNQQLVKQVLDVQTKDKVEGMTWEQLEAHTDPSTPLTLSSQTVNLLTPDRLRTWARESSNFQAVGSRVHHALSGAPADDERTLALENMAAHQHWNGKVVPMEVEDEFGNKMTIHVKFDTRYFNIPNNVMYEKTPGPLTYSSELQAANNEAFEKLETDVRKQIDNLRDEMKEQHAKLSPQDQKWVDALQKAEKSKVALREKVMMTSVDSGKPRESDKFKRWQQQADHIADVVKQRRKDPNLSPEMKEYLDLFEARENVVDLYLDTRELFLGGLGKDLKALDNNRSALASRIIALGALSDEVAVHFGCRSGKDRTGLVDIEVKLLLSQAKLHGRVPSYREQERWPDTTNLRETMTLESGNVFDVVRAVMGANVGLNTGGSASKPLEETSERGQQHAEVTSAAQAYANMASRPPTRAKIPSSFGDQQPTKVIVQHQQ